MQAEVGFPAAALVSAFDHSVCGRLVVECVPAVFVRLPVALDEVLDQREEWVAAERAGPASLPLLELDGSA